jgi:hypothetical protein
MGHRFEIGDRVEYTNVFGYTHQYLIQQRSNTPNEKGFYYKIIIPTKNGQIPKRGGLAIGGIYESELKIAGMGE